MWRSDYFVFPSLQMCFEWFTKGQHDLESDVQQQLFKEKILKLEPYEITMNGTVLHCVCLYQQMENNRDDTIVVTVHCFVFSPQGLIFLKPSLRMWIFVIIVSNGRELNW